MKPDSDIIRVFVIYAVMGLLIAMIFFINLFYVPFTDVLRLNARVERIENQFGEILGDLSRK